MRARPLTDIDPILPLLEHRPLGIMSDIDGTLAPIVPDPEQAEISPGCRTALERLVKRGVRVALISGRSLDKAREIVGLDDVAYAANHGLELWIDGRAESTVLQQEYSSRAAQVRADVGPHLHLPGIIVEAKGPVLAFHYRNAADESDARTAILSAIRASEAADGFAVSEGRKVIELRPPTIIDKGTAVMELATRLRVQAVLCMGDDLTDLDMFRGVEQLKQRGVPGLNVAVCSEESAAELLAATDHYVRGVEGVEWLLEELLRELITRGQ